MEITIEDAPQAFTITGMELEYYNAAMEGKIDAFKEKGGEEIESILTPKKNTILHIHFTNYPERVSETFVEEVLAMCPALLLKTNGKDETILHIASRYGHYKIVRKLINCAKVFPRDIDGVGAEKRLIRALNDKKDTALHVAARYGHIEVVKALINEERDHSYFGKNDGGETPLYIAVERQKWDVIDTILDNSTLPQYDGPNGRTALHAATIFDDGKGTVSKLLTKNSLLAKQADENGWVPLHLAAIFGSSKIVETLVSEDRNTAYMRDNEGRTALLLAALYRNVSAMEKILKNCPDCCELVDKKGCNALHYTTMDRGCYIYPIVSESEKEILKNPPQMRNLYDEKNNDGNTPLHYVARLASKWKTYYEHPLLESHVLEGADTMACNKYGQTPLDVADADMITYYAKNNLYRKLMDCGAKGGARVPDKHLREKEQEKICHPAVDEKEKGNKTNGEDDLSRGAESLSVVAILIATVTCAAGFTLPGGLNQDKGSPILKYNAAFIAFAITDCLSFVLSTSVVLLILYSSVVVKMGRWEKELYDQLIVCCLILTIVAMGFMVIAFGTGLYAVLGVSKGFGVVTLLIVLSFFFIVFIVIHLVQQRTKELITKDKWKPEEIGRPLDQEIHNYRNRHPHFRVREILLSDIV